MVQVPIAQQGHGAHFARSCASWLDIKGLAMFIVCPRTQLSFAYSTDNNFVSSLFFHIFHAFFSLPGKWGVGITFPSNQHITFRLAENWAIWLENSVLLPQFSMTFTPIPFIETAYTCAVILILLRFCASFLLGIVCRGIRTFLPLGH